MITKKLIKPISKVGIANVDLDNYYNKSEIDSKITTIDNEISTKQDILTAGNNITIESNVISSNVNLDNYYNKSEIDNIVNSINQEQETQNNKIETNKNELEDLLNKYNSQQTINQNVETKQQEQDNLIQTNHNDITNLTTQNQEQINTIKTNISNLESQIQELNNPFNGFTQAEVIVQDGNLKFNINFANGDYLIYFTGYFKVDVNGKQDWYYPASQITHSSSTNFYVPCGAYNDSSIVGMPVYRNKSDYKNLTITSLDTLKCFYKKI